jgi:hypothetical protein
MMTVTFIAINVSACGSQTSRSSFGTETKLSDSQKEANYFLEKSKSQWESGDCESAVSSANQAVNVDPNNPMVYVARGTAMSLHAYRCNKQNSDPDISKLKQANQDFEKAIPILKALGDTTNAEQVSVVSSNIKEQIQSFEKVDELADKLSRSIYSGLSRFKSGGQITNLTRWNSLSKIEKLTFVKKFCDLNSEYPHNDARPVIDDLGGSQYDYDTQLEAAVIRTSGMSLLCGEKARDDMQKWAKDTLRDSRDRAQRDAIEVLRNSAIRY